MALLFLFSFQFEFFLLLRQRRQKQMLRNTTKNLNFPPQLFSQFRISLMLPVHIRRKISALQAKNQKQQRDRKYSWDIINNTTKFLHIICLHKFLFLFFISVPLFLLLFRSFYYFALWHYSLQLQLYNELLFYLLVSVLCVSSFFATFCLDLSCGS